MTDSDSATTGEPSAPDGADGVIECHTCGTPGESIDAALSKLRCPDCGYEWSA
jgi:hypothetical protein